MRSSSRHVCVLAILAGSMTGCGARTSGLDPGVDAGTPDARRPTDAPPATTDAPVADAGPPPVCEGLDGAGTFEGFVPIGMLSFPYVIAGVEPPGSHSCPRFFLRAGADPMFSGDYLEIQVPYDGLGPFVPGVRSGTLDVFLAGETWNETIQVDVQRADGLFDTTLPIDAWRGSAEIHQHDATTDLDATIVDAEHRPCFPLCI